MRAPRTHVWETNRLMLDLRVHPTRAWEIGRLERSWGPLSVHSTRAWEIGPKMGRAQFTPHAHGRLASDINPYCVRPNAHGRLL